VCLKDIRVRFPVCVLVFFFFLSFLFFFLPPIELEQMKIDLTVEIPVTFLYFPLSLTFSYFHILTRMCSVSFPLVLYPAFPAQHTHTTSGFRVTNASTRVGVLLHIHFSHKSVILHRERKWDRKTERWSVKALHKALFERPVYISVGHECSVYLYFYIG